MAYVSIVTKQYYGTANTLFLSAVFGLVFRNNCEFLREGAMLTLCQLTDYSIQGAPKPNPRLMLQHQPLMLCCIKSRPDSSSGWTSY